jgi:multiple sugar transport system substrate-binding protein
MTAVAGPAARPGLGEIVQGVFSGDVTDVRAELTKLSDASNRSRDTAIAAAKSKRAKVSRDDFVLPNSKPREDFGPREVPEVRTCL